MIRRFAETGGSVDGETAGPRQALLGALEDTGRLWAGTWRVICVEDGLLVQALGLDDRRPILAGGASEQSGEECIRAICCIGDSETSPSPSLDAARQRILERLAEDPVAILPDTGTLVVKLGRRDEPMGFFIIGGFECLPHRGELLLLRMLGEVLGSFLQRIRGEFADRQHRAEIQRDLARWACLYRIAGLARGDLTEPREYFTRAAALIRDGLAYPEESRVTLRIWDILCVSRGSLVDEAREDPAGRGGGEIAIPLGTSDGGEGLLTVDLPRGLTTHDRQLVDAAGAELSLVIENYRLHGQRDLMEIQLRHTQKIEALGRLSAGLAHEMNTPLQYISDNLTFLSASFKRAVGYLAELRRQMPSRGIPAALKDQMELSYLLYEVPRAIRQSRSGVEHLSSLVSSMRVFAHPDSRSTRETKPEELVLNALNLCRSQVRRVARIHRRIVPGLPAIRTLVGDVTQVLVNLLINAAQAVESRNKITGRTRGLIQITVRRIEGGTEFRISDNGSGIPEDLQGRLFEPFVTTKKPGSGTGQGLSIVREIVEHRLGGELLFWSRPGEGSEFAVILPDRGE